MATPFYVTPISDCPVVGGVQMTYLTDQLHVARVDR